jgi:ergothioneine biosynthesis protein EgtB
VKQQAWRAPLCWERDTTYTTGWCVFTLRGGYPLSTLLDTPICHVSFFEADAFARWRGRRLPTKAEWEHAANGKPILGNLLENGRLNPALSPSHALNQLFGDTWEWTASPYTGYPGYKPLPGVLGEYNDKFMSNQMILRGGSCVTPSSHLRATYRNFFQPATRWQFTGIRLAA